MAFNLRNRSFVKEIDFEPRGLRFLLQLSESLKLAKYAGTEVSVPSAGAGIRLAGLGDHHRPVGITNTLALSITERVREVGLLRAVAMTRGQLRSAIRWESVIIALQGTALGLVIGSFFGWALVRALHDQGITVFRMPIGRLAVVVVLACVAGVISAVPPSRHAARIDVLRAVVSD